PLTLAGLALVAVAAMGRWPAPRDAVSKD
ncbi:MAG: hypothetical protein QOC69_2154, partial [Mycobacterium sp.]|nr:hypothetical protein [Mycobacterium sp.]